RRSFGRSTRSRSTARASSRSSRRRRFPTSRHRWTHSRRPALRNCHWSTRAGRARLRDDARLSTIERLSTITQGGDDRGIVSVEPQDSPGAPRAAAPRKAAPRGQQVVEALRSAIVAGRYEPGERLIETSLSEELGTSRGPVREALRQLEKEGRG